MLPLVEILPVALTSFATKIWLAVILLLAVMLVALIPEPPVDVLLPITILLAYKVLLVLILPDAVMFPNVDILPVAFIHFEVIIRLKVAFPLAVRAECTSKVWKWPSHPWIWPLPDWVMFPLAVKWFVCIPEPFWTTTWDEVRCGMLDLVTFNSFQLTREPVLTNNSFASLTHIVVPSTFTPIEFPSININ